MKTPELRRFLFCFIPIFFAGCASEYSSSVLSGLREKAKSGDPVAQRNLAAKLDFGPPGAQDRTEAARWYQLAAEQGEAVAQNNLGSFYQYGLGVPTNFNKAV